MPQVNSQISIGSRTLSEVIPYTEIVRVVQEVDNTDVGITLLSFSQTKGTNVLAGSKGFFVYNRSNVGAEVLFDINDWKDNTSNVDVTNSVAVDGTTATTIRTISALIPAKGKIYMCNGRIISYATSASAGNANTKDNQAPTSVGYKDSLVDTGAVVATADVVLTVADSDYFKVDDLLQLGTTVSGVDKKEIVRVTSINSLTEVGIERALYGTTAIDSGAQTTSAASGADIYFPFFNTIAPAPLFGGLMTPQTSKSGRYHSMNFFGYGRTADGLVDGIVPGSVAIKFYSQPYGEFGLRGITPNTDSGLIAGNTYYFGVSLDGSSAYDVTLIVDASNTKFGGANGIISKIQSVLDTQYSTGGSALLNKGASIGLVGGDLRITSHSRLTSSDVTITTGVGGDATSNLIGNALGVFPANAGSKAQPRLPADIVRDKASYDSIPNVHQFAYDDGKGVISGTARGTINYETGEINITGPTEAHFVFSVAHSSAHSGGVSTTTDNFNNIISIKARSCNSKIPALIEIEGYN